MRIRFLVLIAMLLGLSVPLAAPAPIVAQTATPLLAAPAALDLTLGLGQSLSQQINISNSSAITVQPLLYEAYAQAQIAQLADTSPLQVSLPQQRTRIDPQISAQGSRDEPIQFLVYLRDQVDLGAARQIDDWNERGEYVYRTLHEQAEQSQQSLRQDLQARGLPFQPLWIVNAVLVQGQVADAYALAEQHQEVAMLRANHQSAQTAQAALSITKRLEGEADTSLQGFEQAPASPCNLEQPHNPICWNIQSLGADRVWQEFGVTGQGIVLANNDSGAIYSHPALLGSYRGHQLDGSLVHDYNWFDPQGLLPEPADPNGHGTHTLGIMVGAGTSLTEPAIGVAPGARWIATRGCKSSYCSESDLILAAQWLLAPTDRYNQHPRPDLRPMIINNSWAGSPEDSWYAGYTAAWQAAGIFSVFATGNGQLSADKPCGRVGAPANYSDVIAVGAIDERDDIASFSLFGATADGRIKPDFVAPGTSSKGAAGIYSSSNSPQTPYRFLQGTSMAAPHVAGAVALLWAANPALIGNIRATVDILRSTARPLYDMRCGGDASGVPNNVYGYGRIDAFAAVAKAHVDVPWLSFEAQPPLEGNTSQTLSVHIDGTKLPGPGQYQARIQIYPTTLSAQPLTIPVTITVLPDQSAAILEGQVLDAVSGVALHARVTQAGGAATSSDADGRYTLIMMPGSYTVQISAAGYMSSAEPIQLVAGRQQLVSKLQRDSASIQAALGTSHIQLAYRQMKELPLAVKNTGSQTLHYQVELDHDEYGIWHSDEAGGPRYQWLELPANATILGPSPTGVSGPFAINQNMRIYDWANTSMYIGSNGVLSFVASAASISNSGRCMPDHSFPLYSIAPLRADFDLTQGGQIGYGLVDTADQGPVLVVSYENLAVHGQPPEQRYSFQVLLFIDGRIIFQYNTIPALLDGMTAGVQRSPAQYQSLGCGQQLPIRSQTAIEFFPQMSSEFWLSSSSEQFSVLPGAEQQIALSVRWARPGKRELRSQLRIRSNDPWHATLILPVSLSTAAAPYELRLLDVRNGPKP